MSRIFHSGSRARLLWTAFSLAGLVGLNLPWWTLRVSGHFGATPGLYEDANAFLWKVAKEQPHGPLGRNDFSTFVASVALVPLTTLSLVLLVLSSFMPLISNFIDRRRERTFLYLQVLVVTTLFASYSFGLFLNLAYVKIPVVWGWEYNLVGVNVFSGVLLRVEGGSLVFSTFLTFGFWYTAAALIIPLMTYFKNSKMDAGRRDRPGESSGRRALLTFSVLLLLSVLVSALINVQILVNTGSFLASSAPSGTVVGGRLRTDVRWTRANSPYIVASDMVVEVGVTLTIEPGVIVKFANGTSLYVDGVLIALGDETHRIRFTSNATTPKVGDWGGVKFRDSSPDNASRIDWVTIEYSDTGISLTDSKQRISNMIASHNRIGVYGSASISNSSFIKNFYGVFGYSSVGPVSVFNSTFVNNTRGVYGSDWGYSPVSVSHSSFKNNEVGVYGKVSASHSSFVNNTYGYYGSYQYASVSYSSFINNMYAYYGFYGSVSYSSFANNTYGVYGGGSASISVSHSNFANNTYGVYSYYKVSVSNSAILYSRDGLSIAQGTVTYTNIFSNSRYNLKVLSSYPINATNNYWGTPNTTLIDQHIYDYYDNHSLGEVTYRPFLTSPYVLNST